ncbi:uncharacterized protein EMH_0088930 [Eimeria mitis]|uniref:Uncharacterized protein n=1 Tax=Eimeria mitis TaxID=44415 RepID=U6KDB9_9EIME|nr:uncharacterized protein EMH_0088930 [Eimeria mitis]CDJ34247.1 hypothetical protein, conserved [Eimeria mitis]
MKQRPRECKQNREEADPPQRGVSEALGDLVVVATHLQQQQQKGEIGQLFLHQEMTDQEAEGGKGTPQTPGEEKMQAAERAAQQPRHRTEALQPAGGHDRRQHQTKDALPQVEGQDQLQHQRQKIQSQAEQGELRLHNLERILSQAEEHELLLPQGPVTSLSQVDEHAQLHAQQMNHLQQAELRRLPSQKKTPAQAEGHDRQQLQQGNLQWQQEGPDLQ